VTTRLVVFTAFILRSCVLERKTVNGDNTRSVKAVIKTHIFHVREFLQSKDNGMERDQEQWLRWRWIQLRVADISSVSDTTSRA